MSEQGTATAPPWHERMDAPQFAGWLHLSAFASLLGIPAFVGPLVMWLLRRDRSPFVDQHGASAVNFHLTLLLVSMVIGAGAFFAILSVVGIFVVLPVLAVVLLVAVVVQIVFPVLAFQAAHQGRPYHYPLAIPFLKARPPRL